MTSYPRRNPEEDPLLTPENSVLLVIDYQPTQVSSIQSISHPQLIKNVSFTIKLAKAYHVPIVLSTVNVATGRNADTLKALRDLMPDQPTFDRTNINAWEDQDFNKAVHATGRQNLIMCALWTEACMAFPTLDALREGYHVFPVVDAIGGTSTLAHETALRRVEQAGAELISNAQLACEWQRDWNRAEYAHDFVKLMFENDDFFHAE
ncbi:hydrolase [Lacticaseibacillus camelliae]|uniref:Isochorismatase hydrolase n=1 Tax=Lacticaseibacillus camelliae DSM 22697 = JCM 13995 TaxID=1423730 RepID=A0A0R2FAF8_9LACO|nr:hydrolase [Lacticaseibacillus camelliae]KRN25070.1 isochorismatase hydrolase [Lacticaseibacillus camelliae DSM 22697 = JCM 13995]